MSLLDSFEKVMQITQSGEGQLTIPEGIMYDGKPFTVKVDGKMNAHLAQQWHDVVRKEYERQEVKATESNRPRTPDVVPTGEQAPDPAGGPRVGPTAPEAVPSVEEVLQARLDSAEESEAALSDHIDGLSRDLAGTRAEIGKLRVALEAMANAQGDG